MSECGAGVEGLGGPWDRRAISPALPLDSASIRVYKQCMASSTAHITAAQRKILEEIVRKGRVIGYGSSWRTLGALRRRGLVTMDARGDYAITDAGRAALEG